MIRDQMEKELVRDEDLRLKPYLDKKGNVTIGVGRNLSFVGISEPEAFVFLSNDIDRTMKDPDLELPWWRNLDEVRQRVILNMGFNMGVKWIDPDTNAIRGLVTFRTTLGLVKGGFYEQAAAAMLRSAWADEVGARAIRLSNMMRDGTPLEV